MNKKELTRIYLSIGKKWEEVFAELAKRFAKLHDAPPFFQELFNKKGRRAAKFCCAVSIALLLCTSCENKGIILGGEFQNADRRHMVLYKIEPDNVVVLDTIFLQNGNFSYKLKEKAIGVYLLKYNDTTLLSFLAQGGERLVFSGDAQDLNKTYDVQGSEETRLLLETRRKLDQFYDKTKEWTTLFLQHTYTDDYEKTNAYLNSLYQEEFDAHIDYLTHFIRQNKGKLATMLAFYQKIGNNAFFDEEINNDLLREIYEGLQLTYPKSIYVEDLKEKLQCP